MSAAVILYTAVLVVVALALWGAYRLLGTPSRLPPGDYRLVLEDVAVTVSKAAERLRAAVQSTDDRVTLEDVATESRKIFQTGYYQTLRLRPSSGPDGARAIRETLGQACEAYDWASRMVGSESVKNPVILDAARRLLDAGDRDLKASVQALETGMTAPSGSSSP